MADANRERERDRLAYLEYVCEKAGGVASHTHLVARADIARDLELDEVEVGGYLSENGYLNYDSTEEVYLTKKGLQHLRSLGRCLDPKGKEGRLTGDELNSAALRFLQLLYDEVDGIPGMSHDAPFVPLATQAGIEHSDDIEYVVLEYLDKKQGMIRINGLSAAYLTEKGVREVNRSREN